MLLTSRSTLPSSTTTTAIAIATITTTATSISTWPPSPAISPPAAAAAEAARRADALENHEGVLGSLEGLLEDGLLLAGNRRVLLEKRAYI